MRALPIMARDRRARCLRRHALGAAAGRAGRRPRAASASSCRCWRAPRSRSASPASSSRRTRTPTTRPSDGPNMVPLERHAGAARAADGLRPHGEGVGRAKSRIVVARMERSAMRTLARTPDCAAAPLHPGYAVFVSRNPTSRPQGRNAVGLATRARSSGRQERANRQISSSGMGLAKR